MNISSIRIVPIIVNTLQERDFISNQLISEIKWTLLGKKMYPRKFREDACNSLQLIDLIPDNLNRVTG